MNKIKLFITNNFKNLTYFYRQVHYRLFVMVFLSIIVGVLDGFGLAMFMPLLEMVNDIDQPTGENMGNLKFIVHGMQNLGLSITLTNVLLIMIIFFIIKGIVKFVSQSYQVIIRRYFISNLRRNLIKEFNNVSYKYFVESDVGRIQNIMTVEVERVSGAFYNYAATMEQTVLMIVYMTFAFIVDVKFALLVSLGGWLTNLLYKLIYEKTKGASRYFSKDSNLFQGQIIQYITNFKYLKATAYHENFTHKLFDSIKLIEQNRKKIGIFSAILRSAREPLLIIVIALVVLVQINLFNALLGPILVSLLFFYRALSALLSLQDSYNRFLEQSGSMENLIDFSNLLKNNIEKHGTKTIKSFNSCILLKNVSFSYGDEIVLENINLAIEKNKTIAIVGESGSGKTTLINIIAGLLPLDKGEMWIDGINRNDLDISSYQRRIGYITQEPVIFNDTIYNNITLWSEKNQYNIKRFEDVLIKSELKEFVDGQLSGMETLLGMNGVNLSGGEKQRIAIARELFKNIDILIMDEATSSLDSETEKSIQKSIDNLMGDYTILIVAHRISTIRNANKIIVMNKGKIHNIGTFDELRENSESFKKMVLLQEI